MARIIIRERDLTGNYANDDFTDIVYVPGFAKTPIYETDDNGSTVFDSQGNPVLKCFNKPQHVYTQAQFIALFGDEPASYTYTLSANGLNISNTAGNVVYVYDEDTDTYTVTVYDSAYVYARELLYRGLPVLYHQLNDVALEGDDKTSELATMFSGDTTKYCKWFEKTLREKMLNDDYVEQLRDRGMFTFKYLTTGGYPTFLVEDGVLDVNKASMLNTAEELPAKGVKGWHYYYPHNKKYNLCVWSPSAERPDQPWVTTENTDILAEDLTLGLIDESWKVMSNLLSIAAEKEADDNSVTSDDKLACGRGDCIFIIDHENKPSVTALQFRDVAQTLKSKFSSTQLEYAAMFTPWCNYDLTFGHAVNDVAQTSKWMMPGSYAYLTCLADAIKNYDNWNAIAGVTRGTVKNINNILLDKTLTNTMANRCQGDPEEAVRSDKNAISINCITEIKPYGQVIWGNRTLQIADNYKHVTAMGFLNLRNEVSDIRKLCYRAARRWMFEQNSSLLWSNFAGMITPLLDKMKTGYGISRYELVRSAETQKHKLYAKLRIWPIYAVEMFDITIEILDEEAEISQG